MKFFAYDPDSGFELFATESEAKEYAMNAIDYYRGESCDGWPEEVDQVCWGELKQETVMCDKRLSENSAFSYYCDYQLKDVE